MRSLNVFKLARNVDLKTHTGDTKSCLRPTQKYSDIHPSNRATYKRVDPDMVVTQGTSFDSIGTACIVPTTVPNGTNNVDPIQDPSDDDGQGKAHTNGGKIMEKSEPEPYKRLINEAPFTCTAQEPDLDPVSVVVVDGNNSISNISGHTRNSSSSGQISRAASTRSKADSHISISTLNMDWIDPELIKQGREFFRRNFLAILFAHFIGLIFLLTIRPVAAILLRNGKFHKPAKHHNWHLHLSLFRKLISVYRSNVDFNDLDDPVVSEILSLRRSACKEAKNFRKFVPPPAQELQLTPEQEELLAAVKADLNDGSKNVPLCSQVEVKDVAKIFATINPDVPWSQYDLAMTQFAFFGLVALFPKTFGIHCTKGLQGFVHIWAVLGALFGLENRFNLCRKENWDEETNGRIFQHVFLFSLRIMDNGSFKMCGALCEGVGYFSLFSTRIGTTFRFILRELAGVGNTKNVDARVKWFERELCYGFCKLWNRFLVRIFLLRILANWIARAVLALAGVVMRGQLSYRSWRAKRRRRKAQEFVVGIYNNSN